MLKREPRPPLTLCGSVKGLVRPTPEFPSHAPPPALPARRGRRAPALDATECLDERPTRLVGGGGVRKVFGHIGGKKHDVGALGIAGGVLAANRAAEIVLLKQITSATLFTRLLHIDAFHARWLSAR